MPVVTLPLAQGYYVSESLPLSAQVCVNMYPSIPETLTITEANLFGIPGIELLADAGTSNTNRGAHVFNDVPYFVNGTELYKLILTFDALGAEIFTLTQVGASGVIPGSERVFMSDNGTQLCIAVPELTAQFNSFIVDTSDVVTQISDGDFDGPVAGVVFANGFFLFPKKDGNKFFKSALRNGLAYNALDFADAEADPDPIKALAVYRNQLFVMGSKTMEGFQIVPTVDFPYINSGIVEQKGLISPATIKEVEGMLFWLGGAAREKPQILMYDGAQPQAISTRAIEAALRTFSTNDLEMAFSWDYSEDGSDFIAFTFPTTTFVFDLSTQAWHERKSENDEGQKVSYRISNIVEAYSFLLAGDILNGNIGRISKDVFTEYGTTIEARVILPPIDNSGDRTFVNRVELVAETGVGLVPNQQGDDPEIRLIWSDDGGRTFEDPISETLGAIGEYFHRPYWTELGSFQRSRMFGLLMSDPVKRTFIKFEVDIDA